MNSKCVEVAGVRKVIISHSDELIHIFISSKLSSDHSSGFWWFENKRSQKF